MALDLVIRTTDPGEIEGVSAFVARVFDAFVAPDLEPEGATEFKRHITAQAIKQRLEQGGLLLLAESGGELAGMIEIRDRCHITMFFVDDKHQGQGVGKALFHEALTRRRQADPDLAEVTVNSSLYAVDIYGRMGFVATSPEQLHNGIRFVPMRLRL